MRKTIVLSKYKELNSLMSRNTESYFKTIKNIDKETKLANRSR